MPPNKSNYSKRPVRRVRLPRIGLRKTKSLFEEYFYAFLVTISVVVTILGKAVGLRDRKSTRLNSSHGYISYAVFCLKKKKNCNACARTGGGHSHACVAVAG